MEIAEAQAQCTDIECLKFLLQSLQERIIICPDRHIAYALAADRDVQVSWTQAVRNVSQISAGRKFRISHDTLACRVSRLTLFHRAG